MDSYIRDTLDIWHIGYAKRRNKLLKILRTQNLSKESKQNIKREIEFLNKSIEVLRKLYIGELPI